MCPLCMTTAALTAAGTGTDVATYTRERQGLRKARFLFEKMLGYANHLALHGEELGPRAQHLGNFPQAFGASPQ